MPKELTTDELKGKLPTERTDAKMGNRYTSRLVATETIKKANGEVVPKYVIGFDAPTEAEALMNMYNTLKTMGYDEVTKKVQ